MYTHATATRHAQAHTLTFRPLVTFAHSLTHNDPQGEYVQGLTLEECATLLNVDAYDKDMMQRIYDTALAIKERIYGNRYACGELGTLLASRALFRVCAAGDSFCSGGVFCSSLLACLRHS